jgi:hypothetical protein
MCVKCGLQEQVDQNYSGVSGKEAKEGTVVLVLLLVSCPSSRQRRLSVGTLKTWHGQVIECMDGQMGGVLPILSS